jgi:hypothetical protein
MTEETKEKLTKKLNEINERVFFYTIKYFLDSKEKI